MFIAISIGILNEQESLWTNGIKQNAFFLAKALRYCSFVEDVVVFNTTSIRSPTYSFEEILGFGDIKDRAEVVIELGGQISAEQTEYLKNRTCRLVSYCCGFEYIHVMESIIFGRELFGDNLFINPRYDAIWMIPQVESNSRPYFEVFRKIKGYVAPFVWDPFFLEEASSKLPNKGLWTPPGKPARISILEPNIDIVKFCLYPILIAELAFRQDPEAIELLQVTNTEQLANHSKEFTSLMLQLDIVKNSKAVFTGRQKTPVFLAENTDVVVSHQWENPLNYIYLEVAWQGYPLVHNAHLCADLGYYYENNNLEIGAKQLLDAIHNHPNHYQAYIDKQRYIIQSYLPGNPEMTMDYERLLQQLKSAPLR